MGVEQSKLSEAALAAAGSDELNVEPDVEELERLLDEGVDVNEWSGVDDGEGLTLLQHAASKGVVDSVRLLLERGADVNCPSNAGDPNVTEVVAVQCAAEHGHAEILRMLLEAKGNLELDEGDPLKRTAVGYACVGGKADIDVVALLLAYGGSRDPSWHAEQRARWDDPRSFSVPHVTSQAEGAVREALQNTLRGFDRELSDDERQARYSMQLDLSAWLEATRDWYTPLFYLEHLSPVKTVSLLSEDGAQVDTRVMPGRLSPLDRARDLLLGPEDAPGYDTALLVMKAAGKWSPQTHYLWPEAGRARAVSLLKIVYQIASSQKENQFVEVLIENMMPHAMLTRGTYEEAPSVVKGLVKDAIGNSKRHLEHWAEGNYLRRQLASRPFPGSDERGTDLILLAFRLVQYEANSEVPQHLRGATALEVCDTLMSRSVDRNGERLHPSQVKKTVQLYVEAQMKLDEDYQAWVNGPRNSYRRREAVLHRVKPNDGSSPCVPRFYAEWDDWIAIWNA